MAKKKVFNQKVLVLFTILLLPSFFYLFMYSGEHNYKHLEYYGPKEVVSNPENPDKPDTLYHRIPDFSFINQSGEAVTNEFFEGNIYVADFFFATCPSICPKMATHLLDIQNRFHDKSDFKILSHTVNPEHDTPEVLREYADKVHAKDEVWQFATGPKEDIYDIAFKGYFANASPDSIAPGGFLHSQMLFLIDRDGHIRGMFDGTSTSEMKLLVDAIDALYLEEFVSKKDRS